MVLQNVLGDYKGKQGTIDKHKESQEVTKGYPRLQIIFKGIKRFTRGDRGFVKGYRELQEVT